MKRKPVKELKDYTDEELCNELRRRFSDIVFIGKVKHTPNRNYTNFCGDITTMLGLCQRAIGDILKLEKKETPDAK